MNSFTKGNQFLQLEILGRRSSHLVVRLHYYLLGCYSWLKKGDSENGQEIGRCHPLLPTTECRSLFYSFVLKHGIICPTNEFGVLTLFDHVTIIAIFVRFMIEATLICSRTSVNDDATSETLQLLHSG